MSFWAKEKGRLLVACHDAGGAEIISSWLQKKSLAADADFLLEGPAVKIFQRKLPMIAVISRESAVNNLAAYTRALTGTGWGADLEKTVIALCKKGGIPVAAYLDHWTSYKERFTINGRVELPDEIWVGDEYAYDLARSTFHQAVIRLELNQYLVDAAEGIKALTGVACREDTKINVLYLCEPRHMKYDNPDYWGYTEYQALEEYLSFLAKQSERVGKIRVRLHPSETSGKYNSVLRKFSVIFDIAESANNQLKDDCAWADWVVGCDSMAMVVALVAGKQVFSCIPRGGRKLTLPYKEIIQLFN